MSDALQWLIFRDGELPLGPVSTELLQRGVEAGRVPPDALVQQVGELSWIPVLTALRSVPEPSAPAPVPPSTASLDEEPPFLDRCPQCDRKSLRWRSRTRDWKCTECGRVVGQGEARQMIKATEEAERERFQEQAESNAYARTREDIVKHLQRLVSKTVPRESEDSSASTAGCLVALLCIGGCIAGAHVLLPLAGWMVRWLGGGVVGLFMGGLVASLFSGKTPPSGAMSYKPGRLVLASAQGAGLLASVDAPLLRAAEKLARYHHDPDGELPDDVDDDDNYDEEGEGDGDDDLEEATPLDYLNLTRFGRRTRRLLRGTQILSQLSILLSKEGEVQDRITCETVVDDMSDFGWPLVGLCVLADRHATESQLGKIRDLVSRQLGRGSVTRPEDDLSASES